MPAPHFISINEQSQCWGFVHSKSISVIWSQPWRLQEQFFHNHSYFFQHMSPESVSNFPGCVHRVLFLTNAVSLNGLGLAMCQQDPSGRLQAASPAQCSTSLGTIQPLWKMPIISTQTAEIWRFTEKRAYIYRLGLCGTQQEKKLGKNLRSQPFFQTQGCTSLAALCDMCLW